MKYSDEWIRNLRVVVTRSDNGLSETEDGAESVTSCHKDNDIVVMSAYDPFNIKEEEEEEHSNKKNQDENSILSWNTDLDKSQDRMWSTKFNKFQEQYAPTAMLLGISSLACSSTTSNSAYDTTASMATTSTNRTQNLTDRNISIDDDKGNKVSGDISSATNSNVMTVVEGKEMHERAKQHLEMGELEEALSLFHQILKAKRSKYGSRAHQSVGAALHNVAAVHLRMNQYRRALIVSTEALYIRRKALGSDHLDVAQTLLQLGSVQVAIKDYDSALRSFQEALKIRRTFSSRSGVTLMTNSNARQMGNILSRLGLLHFETGEYLSAVTAFEEALSMYRCCLSQEYCPHSVIAETLSNLGAVRSKRKQYSDAIVAFEEAIMIQKKEFGKCHTIVLDTTDCLAYAYSKYDGHEIALNLYKRALQDLETVINSSGNSSSLDKDCLQEQLFLSCARLLHKMSVLYEKMGNILDAIDCTSRALTIQHSVYHEKNISSSYDEHPNIRVTKDTLSRLIAKQRHQINSQNKFDESRPAGESPNDNSSMVISESKKTERFHRLRKLLRLPHLW